jgi:pyruvyl transferase EpsO
MKNRYDVITELRATLFDAFSRAIGPVSDCALVDFPDYPNVGDSAIWLGEIALLRRLRVRIRYACPCHEYSVDRLRNALPAGGVILINGGGNFGTLWPRHQQLREAILRDCRDYRVIQLPQSIHYADPAGIEATAQAVAAHPDFTLMVRDAASHRIGVEQLGARTVLCPDAAFALAGSLSRRAPTVDCFVLARTDKEKTSVDLAADVRKFASGTSVIVNDWVSEPPSRKVRYATRLRYGMHPGRLPHSARLSEAVCNFVSRVRVDRGMRMLAQGRAVITDRLHGMILSVAAGIPCVALDNSYGKVSGFHRQWLAEFPECALAASVPEALALAGSFESCVAKPA